MGNEGSRITHPQETVNPEGDYATITERGSKDAQAVELLDASGDQMGDTGNPLSTEEKAAGTPYNGQKTVTAAGTAEALASSQTVKSVSIKALAGNTGNVYVGDSSVDSSNGYVLAASQSIDIDIDDLDKIYIDVDTSTEGVCFLAIN